MRMRVVFVFVVVVTALLVVFVPAGGAEDNVPLSPTAVDETGTAINVPNLPDGGRLGDVVVHHRVSRVTEP